MADYGGVDTTNPDIDAQSQASIVIAICISFAIISCVAVGLRFYTRAFLLHRVGADDVTIAVAEVLALVVTLGAGMEVQHGLGRHVWTLSADNILEQAKWLYLVVIIYNLTTNVIKMSFLLQYRRFLAGLWTLRVCKWGLYFIGLWAIIQVTLLATACLPLGTIVPSMKGRCLDTTPIWYFTSAMNIVTDFAVFTIPLPTIFKLRLKRQQKMLVLLIFSIGFFTCIISIYRMFTLTQRTGSKDNTWTGVTVAIWSMIEIHTGILCSCLATLRPFVRRVLPCLADSDYSGTPGAYELNDQQRSRTKRTAASATRAVHHTRRPSDDSEGALKDHAAIFTPRIPGGRRADIYAERKGEGSESCTSVEGMEIVREDGSTTPVGDGKLQIYVKQTFETRESRVPAEGEKKRSSWLAD